MIPLVLNELDVPPMKLYQKGAQRIPQALWNNALPRKTTLYAQEPFALIGEGPEHLREIVYYADHPDHIFKVAQSDTEWRPASEMPPWATRFLNVYNGCWPMRLKNINYRMIIAEGFLAFVDKDYVIDGHCESGSGMPRDWFRRKWDLSYPPGTEYCWDNNPYVWVIEFQPIDLSIYLEKELPEEHYVKWKERKKYA